MKSAVILTVALALASVSVLGEEQRIKSIGDFGDITTKESAEKALQTGIGELQKAGGGIITIPPGAPKEMKADNLSQTSRNTPGVTVIDYRDGFINYRVPQIGKEQTGSWGGLRISRILNMGQKSIEPYGGYPVQSIKNYSISGCSSYHGLLALPAAKGENARCYVETIRGISVGQYLQVDLYKQGGERDSDVIVKTIGWDNDRKLYYFTCDLKYDHPKVGVTIGNKQVVNGLDIDDWSNCANQSMTLQAHRRQYSNGDSFVISGMLSYMGEIMQGTGDEMGVVLNAETVGELDGFHSTVEALDWSKDEITYAPGNVNAHTLADQRPLINMNTKKWISSGTVKIVRPDDWYGMSVNDPRLDVDECIREGIDLKKLRMVFTADGKEVNGLTDCSKLPVKKLKYTYNGKAYPSILGGKPFKNHLGGCIIGSKDCGWTKDVIGRFFAILDESEAIMPKDGDIGYAMAPKRPCYRWYQINDFYENADGTKVIKLLRVRWNAVKAGAPQLFADDNYTWDGHEKALSYAIAPGAWVYSVAEGWADSIQRGGRVDKGEPRKIRVTPQADRGTSFDFEVGDAIEQVVGPDPWHPTPLRIRQFDQLPSTGNGSSISVGNNARVQIPNCIGIGGGGLGREDIEKRKDKKPPFGTIMNIGSLSNVGIEFGAEVMESAIQFNQPNGRPQPLCWKNKIDKDTVLQVNPQTGAFQFAGSGMDLTGQGTANQSGISGTAVQAKNLRGINVSVKAESKTAEIKFQNAEADADYSIVVQPNWITLDAVTEKRSDGFNVEFSVNAPKNAKLDWQLIR